MDQDQVFLYAISDEDAWLVTVRRDFAEMVHINPSRRVSLYEKYEAPVEKIRKAIQDLKEEGFRFVGFIDLKLKELAEV